MSFDKYLNILNIILYRTISGLYINMKVNIVFNTAVARIQSVEKQRADLVNIC